MIQERKRGKIVNWFNVHLLDWAHSSDYVLSLNDLGGFDSWYCSLPTSRQSRWKYQTESIACPQFGEWYFIQRQWGDARAAAWLENLLE